jgi:hypothetical protein
MSAGPLAGRQFLFDYGQNAKFLLHFFINGEVEVTALAGVRYSISNAEIFAVDACEQSPGEYRIRWYDPVEQTELLHHVDFTHGRTDVEIEDKRLNETRRFSGCVSSA